MKYTVRFSPEAREDVGKLLEYLVPRAGEAISRAYIGRLRAFCEGFETFPKRGTVRTDHLPGLRVIGFERSASVAFVVEDESVIILRIFHGGQDIHFDDF
ncbi:type II toxin-antitoxin system RelE/ParE family toxin [Rhizobium sp. VS19-DR104.2]|uniref:type II toxin-antitoxin system RelE/ParE family toxin n=1 Tax=unclassified Rhizobium TaxID=2613769 RepID=UPI001CC42DD6|nr:MULTISPECIES: type II toxin-antitoxin system RelE/ParE family toxin [unclassified Rhizobium]MBZ5762275.1 type II toxin-antitoxin system RelE/ParE family toxin [Rhizobium sp. VS19-DR96]MBZ5768291.1 type II toxin-antitoxin system RelE/ParE family toxin [Rhizobium sp. VS19-DR129.2]MBZ5775837.1 type II toxin-antitoxin system RelE/ParE family toxin [Rhizobium sp. VS19-DRK62.2]MBZ5787142.1 type II toxin-antitoxin system RelE/ParE family toxin [Rhizobium sp. VS19-DR121]MBZ5804217.1 type II toxin-a